MAQPLSGCPCSRSGWLSAWAIAWLSFAVTLPACGRVATGQPDASEGQSDASEGQPDASEGQPDAAPRPPCALSAAFRAPVQIGGVNTTASEIDAWLSDDERMIYVSRGAGGRGSYSTYRASRTSTADPFGAPTALPGFAAVERPSISASGLTLFATTVGGGTVGPYDISVATRSTTATEFGQLAVVPNVNSPNVDDKGAVISRDGKTLYFTSNRSGSGTHIYRATRASESSPFTTPTPIGELGSSSNEGFPVVSGDELTIYFSSDRAGEQDIYVARRSTRLDGFGVPALVKELDATGPRWPVWLSADGCRLYLGNDDAQGPGPHDLWVAQKPE